MLTYTDFQYLVLNTNSIVIDRKSCFDILFASTMMKAVGKTTYTDIETTILGYKHCCCNSKATNEFT